MLRRVLALHTVLCLLATFFTLPAAPTLVCRMTGEPMPPVVADAENRDSCCAVAVTVGADGSDRYALTSPGCCDLRITPDHEQPPAVAAVTPDLGPSAAWVPAPPAIGVPVTTEVAVMPFLLTSVAPRAPPVGAVPARGPPFFS
ncbi:MAG: hypothetical protein SFU56_04015 [Capsulimonadales bacterium]|nr:hypothetical protein [Capsulimonadales bacterium]